MSKILIRMSLLIFGNLLAFLILGFILGAIFGHKEFFLMTCIVISIVPLTLIMFIELKKTNKQLNNISKNKKNDGKKNR